MVDSGPIPGREPEHVSTFSVPHAWGRLLAAFLSAEEFARQFPVAPAWDLAVHQAVRERLGVHAGLERVPDAGKPRARRADGDVLPLLGEFVASMPFQPGLNNLIGFEWMEIAPLVAGHPVAHPLASYGEGLAGELDIATYCLYGHPEIAVQQTEQGLCLMMPSPVPVRPLQAQLIPQRSEVVVRYQLGRPHTPVRVLQVGGRAVAVSGLERLVALLRQGVSEALCLVSYGYGTDVLSFLPTFPRELLEADRPPLLGDFLDDRLSVNIPLRPTVTSVLFQATTVPPV